MAKKPEKKKSAKKPTTEKPGRRYAGKLKAAEKPAPPKIELAEQTPIELERAPQRTQERFAQRIESPEVGRRMLRRLAVNPDASIADMARWNIREEMEQEHRARSMSEAERKLAAAGDPRARGYYTDPNELQAAAAEAQGKTSREKELLRRDRERFKTQKKFFGQGYKRAQGAAGEAFEKAVGIAGAGATEKVPAKILMELRTATKPHEGRGALNRLKQEVRREAARIEPGVLQKLGVKSKDLVKAATSQQARAKVLETLKKVPLRATGTGILKYGAALILLEAGAKYLYGLGKTAQQVYAGDEVKPVWENTPRTLLGAALTPSGRSGEPEAAPAAAPAAPALSPQEQMLQAFGKSDPYTQQIGLDAAARNVELADRVYPALGQAQGEAAGLPALLAAQRMRAYSMLSDGEVPIVQGELGAAVSQQVNQRQAESDAYLRQLRAAFSGVGR